MGLEMKKYTCLLTITILLFFFIGCSSGPAHERVVQDMYDALSDGDHDAYMDTLLPSNRQSPNLIGILSAVSISVGPIGLDLGALTQVSIKELEVKTLSKTDDYALVEARGLIRNPILGFEFPFCDQHDVRLSGGSWYVDMLALERQARLEIILQAREQELQELLEGSQSQQQLSGNPFAQFSDEMAKALDLCR